MATSLLVLHHLDLKDFPRFLGRCLQGCLKLVYLEGRQDQGDLGDFHYDQNHRFLVLEHQNFGGQKGFDRLLGQEPHCCLYR